jgi:hypothetical protein
MASVSDDRQHDLPAGAAITAAQHGYFELLWIEPAR